MAAGSGWRDRPSGMGFSPGAAGRVTRSACAGKPERRTNLGPRASRVIVSRLGDVPCCHRATLAGGGLGGSVGTTKPTAGHRAVWTGQNIAGSCGQSGHAVNDDSNDARRDRLGTLSRAS